MARVRLNETQDLPEDHRWLFERMEAVSALVRGEQRAPILNIFRALSHSPVALRRFMKLGSYFLEEGKLDPKLRELAILRVGLLCHAPYEFSQHIAFARRVGLTDDQIRGIASPTIGLFEPREMAVLAYAGELTSDARVSDATYAAVGSFLNEEEIIELTLVTGFYNMVSRALNALEVDIDPPAQKDLAELGMNL